MENNNEISWEFIPIDIAERLKELNFNDNVMVGFSDSETLRLKLASTTEGVLSFSWDKFDEDTKAPSVRKAFKFFRDNYDLHGIITVNPYSESELYGYKIYGNDSMGVLRCVVSEELNDSPEASEIACLDRLFFLQKALERGFKIHFNGNSPQDEKNK